MCDLLEFRRPVTLKRLGGSGFTIIEVLVTILIIGVLLGLIFPALGRIKDSQRLVECATKLRDLGVGWQLFANAHQDTAVHAGITYYIDGVEVTDYEWPATQYLWRGDFTLPAWTGYGILLEADYVVPETFYCPGAMHDWVLEWDEYQEVYGDEPLLIGAYDPDKMGLSGLIVMSTYYQRGYALGAPERSADPPRRAIVADTHQEYDTDLRLNSHRVGLNVLYTDGSVEFIDCSVSQSVTYESDDKLIALGWGTWDDLDNSDLSE